MTEEFENEFAKILLRLRPPLVNLCELQDGTIVHTGTRGSITIWQALGVNDEMDIVVV
jgi:hypothetical protein